MRTLRPSSGGILLIAIVVCAAACSDGGSPATPTPPPAAPVLSTAIRSGCFGWPSSEFTPDNSAMARTLVQPGAPAVEFSLRDADGRAYSLSGLLATKPVLIMTGSYT